MKSLIFLTALSIFLSACGSGNKSTETTETTVSSTVVKLTNEQLKNAAITVGKIGQRQISSTLKLNGKIDVPPQNMVAVSVPLGGYLKSSRLLPGMRVSRGEVIARIEGQQYIQLQEDFLTAKAKVSYLESEYNRQRDLNQSKASSDKVFQQAEADYRGQQVLINSLAEKLRLAAINPGRITASKISRSVNLYSPINGFVSKVNVNIGQYVSPTEVLFELVNPTDIHLALKVYEKDLEKLQLGQNIIAYTNNEPSKKYSGNISLIGRDLSADGSAVVHCHFETYEKSLFPGTYMNAEVQVKSTTTTAIPTGALVQYEGKQYIFLRKGINTFEIIEVKTGESDGEYTAISFPEQLSLTDQQIVLSGAYTLLMMMKNKQS